VLYLNDPITFDSRFIRLLSWKPSLILGWRAANIPRNTDWSEFDIILSNHQISLQRATELGAKSSQYFYPGFPEFISETVKDEPKDWDVVFSGSLSHEHLKRIEYLKAAAKAPLGEKGEFSIAFFIPLATSYSESLPAGIAMNNQGERWGLDMYRALKHGRIVINAEIDLAKGEAGNMRLFEATGVGSFLLTEYHDNIRQYFEPGVEIETFRNSKELIEKIYYYLAHPEEREAIAICGQERCFRDYSMKKRVQELDNIIHKRPLIKTDRQNTTPENPSKQDLEVYWNPKMSEILETWGEGNVWHELRFIMSGLHGKVLDIACGTGKNIEDLQKFTDLDVYGFDISDFLIRKAIDRGIPVENLSVCDATKTEYSDNFFDYSYSIGALEHFTEKGIYEAISESYRITKRCSFHMVPVSRSGLDEGWMKTNQSYYNNSVAWWMQKYKASYHTVLVLDSLWKDQTSIGKWFICMKGNG